MNSTGKLKIEWTWEEWQASRARRRALASKVGPPVVRRRESSADSKLRKAFGGERGPRFAPPAEK